MPNANIDHFPNWDEALREYRTASAPAARVKFELQLRASKYLAPKNVTRTPVSETAPEGDTRRGEKVNTDRTVGTTPDGERYLLFFTSSGELEKTTDHDYTEVSFQELYDDVMKDKSIAGAIINAAGALVNSAGNGLILPRRELNRLMDTAADAGQEGFVAREASLSVQTGNAWPPELQRALVDALSRRPEVREAYMMARNVAWRDDKPELDFMIDFDGDEAELFAYLAEEMKPHFGDTASRFERIDPDGIQAVRKMLPPVYLRPDVSDKAETVNSAKPRYQLFENWDAEAGAYLANFSGAKDPQITAPFEAKLYASHFYAPLFINGEPRTLTSPEHGTLLLLFTDWGEMAKCGFKPGARVSVLQFPSVHAVLTKQPKLAGTLINAGGVALILPRDHLESLNFAMTGLHTAYPEKNQKHMISRAKSVPSGLAADLSRSLRGHRGVKAVYYLSSSIDGAPQVPMLAVDLIGSEDAVFPVIAGTVRRCIKGVKAFTISKADEALLKIARAKGAPIYTRAG
jgi:hypothetical protein